MNNREQFIEKLNGKISEWTAEIEVLEAKLKQKKADIQPKLESNINDLKNSKEQIQSTLNTIKDASSESWIDVKMGAKSALEDLEIAFQRARERFNQPHDQ